MRVVLIGEMSGTRDGQEWPPRGSTVDLPDDEALTLINGRMAIVAPQPRDVETAMMANDDVEQRVLTTTSGPTRKPRK